MLKRVSTSERTQESAIHVLLGRFNQSDYLVHTNIVVRHLTKEYSQEQTTVMKQISEMTLMEEW